MGKPVFSNGAVLDVHHSGCPADGVSDDSPDLQAFFDKAIAAGHRAFRFPRYGEFVIGAGITIDGVDDLVIEADGAKISHGASADPWMFKFLRVDRARWYGGLITGRRNPFGGVSADDGERWIHHRSGSLSLTVSDVEVREFGGAAISAAAENAYAADVASPTPVNAQSFFDCINLRDTHSLLNTKGGGYNQVSVSNVHAERSVGIIKIDGEQDRPTEHPDYGNISGFVVSNLTGKDMSCDGVTEAALVQVEEDINGGVEINTVTLTDSTNVGLLRITRGQTNQETRHISLSNASVARMDNPRSSANPAVLNRGGRNVKISNSQFIGADVYTTDMNSVRGLTKVDGCDFYGATTNGQVGGQVRTFRGDAWIQGSRFIESGSGITAPTAAVDASDTIHRSSVWIDQAFPQQISGAGTHVDNSDVWTFTP